MSCIGTIDALKQVERGLSDSNLSVLKAVEEVLSHRDG